jgi:ubiquinone/menaquinone biosynthesis C-methylase UbiE
MFQHRSSSFELLDEENIPQQDLFQNLKELDVINRYLGGHNVVLAGIKHFAKLPNPTIVEMGSGGGDNLRAVAKWLKKDATYIGVDLKNDCTAFAQKTTQNTSISFQTADYRNIESTATVDIFYNSLFTHHFTDDQVVEMLRWMYENSARGFFIADLHRHWLAYYSIKFITALFSKSYLVKNDAPLSVLRGFTKKEWKILLEKAEIPTYTIQWKWAFRHLIVVIK